MATKDWMEVSRQSLDSHGKKWVYSEFYKANSNLFALIYLDKEYPKGRQWVVASGTYEDTGYDSFANVIQAKRFAKQYMRTH